MADEIYDRRHSSDKDFPIENCIHFSLFGGVFSMRFYVKTYHNHNIKHISCFAIYKFL